MSRTPFITSQNPRFIEEPCSGGGALAQLLVSVRDQGELLDARQTNVSIVDLKEPKRGPLAAAEKKLWESAAMIWCRDQESPPHAKLSAALGERAEALEVAGDLPSGFDFAKVGPSGCDTHERLGRLWEEVRTGLPVETELVGVAYADAAAAGCLEPEQVFELVKANGMKRCLIDTFVKDGRSTIDHLGHARLRELHSLTQRLGLWWAVAGSIRCSAVAEIKNQGWMPDCFGVRGDVCQGDRTAVVSKTRVAAWLHQLNSI